MKNLNRRGFIQGATVLAAGAAIGIPAYKGLKEHGPIDLRLYLFSKDPIVIKVVAFSDEKKDLFGIRTLSHKTEMRIPLSEVKRLVESGVIAEKVVVEFEGEDGVVERNLATIARGEGDLTFKGSGNKESAPLRVKLADVQNVL